jgi:hypothetical protein
LTTDSRIDTRLVASYLNCPRCGLSIKVRSQWLTIRHCPRCVARTRIAVELFVSTLPTEALYAANSHPHLGDIEHRAATSNEPTPLGRDVLDRAQALRSRANGRPATLYARLPPQPRPWRSRALVAGNFRASDVQCNLRTSPRCSHRVPGLQVHR